MNRNELIEVIGRARAEQAARRRTGVPDGVHLGPLTLEAMDGAQWRDQDEFPSDQVWANEFEKLLSFAVVEEQFEQYRGVLRGNKSQRDSGISELRVGFFFKRNGFPVIQWRPVGANNREGEYEISAPPNCGIFVEVKAPGWEGELTEEEIKAGRTKEDKYLQYEGRAIAPWDRIQFAVDKAYGKFDGTKSNLLVIADDLFLGLRHGTEQQVSQALYTEGFFTDTSHENLGGVGIFWEEYGIEGIAYQMRLFLNPHAKATASLANSFIRAFNGKTMEIVRRPKRPLKETKPLIILTDL